MSGTLIKLLLIEDNLAEARLLCEFLKGSRLKQVEVIHVKRLAEALHQLDQVCQMAQDWERLEDLKGSDDLDDLDRSETIQDPKHLKDPQSTQAPDRSKAPNELKDPALLSTNPRDPHVRDPAFTHPDLTDPDARDPDDFKIPKPTESQDPKILADRSQTHHRPDLANRTHDRTALVDHIDDRRRFDAVLLDLTLPDSQGLESLEVLLQRAPSLPIVVLTNTNDDELALQAVRQGAQDYLVKRLINPDLLTRSLTYAIERKQLIETLRTVNAMLVQGIEKRTTELIRAQEINQLKTEVVSMLSHDFRNPLNTILISAGLLQDMDLTRLGSRRTNPIRAIRAAIQNMTQILDEVAWINHTDRGMLQCRPSALNLHQFCQELADEMLIKAQETHQIEVIISEDLAATYWDQNLLWHILSNLLANALKYSPEGGLIILKVMLNGDQAIFSVQDQGMGIPIEDQDLLFHPFHRASNTGSIPGTGLGLAIVKRCVDAYGGTIEFESQLGIGSVFRVCLPICRSIKSKEKAGEEICPPDRLITNQLLYP